MFKKKIIYILFTMSMILLMIAIQQAGAVDVGSCGVGINTDGGYYDLTQNINSTSTCLTISNNNITIDGHGKTISFANSSSGRGISIQGYNNITIKNINIVNGNKSSSSSVGIFLGFNGVGTNNSLIENVTLNSSNSTDTASYALMLQYWSINNTIKNITAIANNSQTIFAYNSAYNNSFINITANSITKPAFWLSTNSNNNTILNLTANSVSGNAIFVSANSNWNNITDSLGNSSTSSGILIQGSNNTYLTNTVGRSNSYHGIYIDTLNSATTLYNSSGYSNTQYGIYDYGSYDVLTNVIGDSTVSHGIWVESSIESTFTNITGISRGSGDGLVVNSSSNVVVSNSTLVSESGFGLYTHYFGSNTYTNINALSNTSYGVASTFTSNNTFTGGSYTSNDSSNISANSFACDYFFHNATGTFINTNFTGNRVVCFDPSDGDSTFNLDYSGSSIFLNTTSQGATVKRKVLSWTQSNISFTENSSARVNGFNNITNFSISGLYPFTVYSSDNGSYSKFNLSNNIGNFNFTTSHTSNISTTIKILLYNFSIIPSDYNNFTISNISIWGTSGDYRKIWNESSTNATTTSLHYIRGFPNLAYVTIYVDGSLASTIKADNAGGITFNYVGGYSEHQFETLLASISELAAASCSEQKNQYNTTILLMAIALMIASFGIVLKSINVGNSGGTGILANSEGIITGISTGIIALGMIVFGTYLVNAIPCVI